MREQEPARPTEVAPHPAWAVWLGATGWWLADALFSVSQVQLLQRIGEAEVSGGELWRMSLASALLLVVVGRATFVVLTQDLIGSARRG
ncbi:hypothetical protein [Myxococcus xanthus]|uniref:hypothetical protein n=1 Tax=Myxococcus xanthus TaxID=34 RepID=UPI00191CC56B|nr:hypothetical protein [Myxococcus xanthus]